MFPLTMASGHTPTADELSSAVAAILKEEKSGDLDVKAIHERLLKEHGGWKVPERRLHKFVKRHRGGGAEASAATKSKPPAAVPAVLKRLFQPGKPASPKAPVPTPGSVGAAGGGAAAGSPGRSTAANSVDCGGTVSSEGIPSVVTMTTTVPPTPLADADAASGSAAGGDLAGDELEASAVPAVQRQTAEGTDLFANKGADEDESVATNKPCFFCEGMGSGGCSIL